jgi:hypothetical protein
MIMDFKIYEEEICRYLSKNYVVIDKKFFTTYDNKDEWGYEILKSLPQIFDVNIDVCSAIFETWGLRNGFEPKTFDEDWREAMNPKKLKVKWTPEIAQDLHGYGIDAESEIISLLSQEIAREIDAKILRDLGSKIKTSEDFLSVVRCVGYDTTPAIYDPMTFMPHKGFVSMKYSDVRKERDNNPIWQNWIRTREQNQET